MQKKIEYPEFPLFRFIIKSLKDWAINSHMKCFIFEQTHEQWKAFSEFISKRN